MKTMMMTGALILFSSLLSAQEKNKQVTVKIKKVETVNGVTTVTDTSYTTDEATAIKAGGRDIQIVEASSGGEGKKVVIMNEEVVAGEGSDVKIIRSGADIDADIAKAMAEAGVEMNDKGTCVKKMIVINDEDKDGKHEKKMTKVVIIHKAKITEATPEDAKLLGKTNGLSDNKLAVEKMDFYPNPSSGKFNLKFDLKEKGNTDVTIMNMEGKKIYSEKLKDFSGHYDKEIDISNNPKGVYFVRIEQGQHSQLKKIVLE